jgi:hypothetical protein
VWRSDPPWPQGLRQWWSPLREGDALTVIATQDETKARRTWRFSTVDAPPSPCPQHPQPFPVQGSVQGNVIPSNLERILW